MRKNKQNEKNKYCQYYTDEKTALFMASLFTEKTQAAFLDAGAGYGALSSAYCHYQYPKSCDLWEIDPLLWEKLEENAKRFRGVVRVHKSDFIFDAASFICENKNIKYDHIILNPPYKKLNKNSIYRELINSIGIDSSNLYTCFVNLALRLLSENGELVAIIPRSFCNGPYHKKFRNFLLENFMIKHIHVFKSRKNIFEGVLQEIIIIKILKQKSKLNYDLVISHSSDGNLEDMISAVNNINSILLDENIISLPDEILKNNNNFNYRLCDLGVDISTGPIVDFRIPSHLYMENMILNDKNVIPLIRPSHFSKKKFNWPIGLKRTEGLIYDELIKKLFYPSGYYVIIKRMTSKEEKSRIVAQVVGPDVLHHEFFAFENHVNVIHQNKKGLPRELAIGIAAHLNSKFIDAEFRSFSGHTQVNVSDIKKLSFPSYEEVIVSV